MHHSNSLSRYQSVPRIHSAPCQFPVTPPSIYPSFVKTKEKYVGMHFRTDTQNMFEDHFDDKARSARYCAHRIMGIGDWTGRLTPKELRILYIARVDYYLIHCCEICPDSENVHVNQLFKIQADFIRQMLNVPSHSLLTPFFTETGIMPLHIRRLNLLLGYPQYVLSLPSCHLARMSLNSSIELAARSKKSWALDVLTAIIKLPFTCAPLGLATATAASIEDYRKNIEARVLGWLQHEIDSSVKLYLLHGRREPQKDRSPVQKTLFLRHDLFMIKTQEHREALISIHEFNPPTCPDHAHRPVPRRPLFNSELHSSITLAAPSSNMMFRSL